MAQELVGAAAFIYSVLAADGTLTAIVPAARISADFADEGMAYPLILFSLQSSQDSRGLGTYRAMSRSVYYVRVIGKGGGYVDLQAAANRIDALLTVRTPQSVTIGSVTYTILGSVRERAIQRADAVNGIRYPSLGGFYALNVQ